MTVFKEHKAKIYFLLAQLIILIPKIIISLNAIPCTDIADEVAMLKVPAYLAGYDWSSSTGAASYYGFGYFALFFPLFLLKLDIITIYRTILIITSLTECVIPAICYYMMEKYWDIKSDFDKMLITIIASYITVNPPYNLINEHILSIIMWIIVLLLCKLITEQRRKKKNVLSLLLTLSLVYSLTIHTRAIIYLIAIVVIIGFYYFMYREWIVTKIFPITLIVSYIGIDFLISFVQKCVWGGNNLVNSSVSIPKDLNWFDYIVSFFDIILGNVGGSFIFSKSFCGFMLVAIILYLAGIVKKKCKMKEENTIFEKTFLVVALVSLFCIVATIGGIGIQHMKGVGEAISEETVNAYEFKFLVYIRYYIVYAAPIFMLGLVLYVKKVVYYKKTFVSGFVLTLIIYVLWGNRIIPYISETYFGINNFYTFSWMLGKTASDRIDVIEHWAIVLLSIDFAMVMVCSLRSEKYKYLSISLMAVFLIYQFIYFPFYYSDIVSESQYNEINACLEYIEEVKAENEDLTIYVYDKQNRLPYLVQVYNYDMNVIAGLPDKDEASAIIISNVNIEEELSYRYESIELEKNEWVYTLK